MGRRPTLLYNHKEYINHKKKNGTRRLTQAILVSIMYEIISCFIKKIIYWLKPTERLNVKDLCGRTENLFWQELKDLEIYSLNEEKSRQKTKNQQRIQIENDPNFQCFLLVSHTFTF